MYPVVTPLAFRRAEQILKEMVTTSSYVISMKLLSFHTDIISA